MPIFIRSGSIQGNRYIRSPIINAASFESPTTLGSITIGSIVGSFHSYVVNRSAGGSQGAFASTKLSAESYTDPTTLTSNTQYIYTITPYYNDGKAGPVFTAVVNPNNGSTPGKIYTLASTASIAPTLVNANGSKNSVYMTWTNSGYTSIHIQNATTAGSAVTMYTATSGIALHNSSGKDTLITNTRYTYTFRAGNGDGLINPTRIELNTCTWATAPTLAYNGEGSSTSVISFSFTGGSFTNLSLQTTLGVQITTKTTSPYTSASLYGANTQKTYYAVPLNSLGYSNISNYASVLTCTWATVPTLTYAGATSSVSAISFSFSGGAFTSLSVQTTLGTELAKVSTSPYKSPASYTANQTVTYYACPVNALGYYNNTVYASVSTCTWASSPTLTYFGAGSSTTAISFSFTGGIYTNLSLQTTLGTELARTTTSPYKSASLYSANQSVTYYMVPINALAYSNTSNNASVATCTWATCNTPTFSGTIATGTTLSCTGTFSRVYITYSGSGSPATGTTVAANNSISQAFTSMTSSTAYTFTCAPINALNYRSSNGASNSVTIPIFGPTAYININFQNNYNNTGSSGVTVTKVDTNNLISYNTSIYTKGSYSLKFNNATSLSLGYLTFNLTNFSTPFTVCFWVYLNAISSKNSQMMGITTSKGATTNIFILFNGSSAKWMNYNSMCSFRGAANSETSPLPTGKWMHLAATFTNQGANNTIKTFYNGGNAYNSGGGGVTNTNTSFANANLSGKIGTYKFYLGMDYMTSTTFGDWGLNGNMNQFLVFNSALTEEEIYKIYNGTYVYN